MNRKGFTLLELIVVIIILGILATLGFMQYGKMMEKARAAEARTIAGAIRTAAAAHYTEYQCLACTAPTPSFTAARAGITSVTGGGVPNACAGQSTNYFAYSVPAIGATSLTIQAARCTAEGKLPPAASTYNVLLATDFAAGTDIWTSGI